MKTTVLSIGAVITLSLAVGTKSGNTEADVNQSRGSMINNITQGTFHESIQEAIDAAVGGDEIEVAPGTYLEQINLLGKAITLRSTDGPLVTTILSSAAGPAVTCNNNEGPDTVLRGFTITTGFSIDAGGMYNNGASPTVTNCRFSGSSAANGGGMYNSFSSPTITNCTFSGNTASYFGGGMYNYSSSPTLINCTISGNASPGNIDGGIGGGMYNGSSNPTLTNCIVWGNTAVTTPQIAGGATVTYSNVQGGWSGEGNIDANPLFVADLDLGDGSPCINAGDNGAVPVGVTTDIDGDDRIQHCRVDMGAHETQFIGPDCNSNSVADVCELADGTSPDCNINGVPDECEPGGIEDCNTNGTPDLCDIFTQTVSDCNANAVPDECDTAAGTSPDCNVNVIPDECEPGGIEDCDTNGTPDLCDIFTGTASDCNANTVPDECEAGWLDDCNENGTPDLCDIHVGTSLDVDGDAIPDECEPIHNVTQNSYHVTIQEAIVSASGGDDIEVAPGTYVERINLLGKAITLRSTGGPEVTVIDGLNAGSVITCNSGETRNTVIEGFTVTNGTGTDVSGGTRGGGMYNYSASPTVTNCTFIRNSATSSGGGMYNERSSPMVTDCTFTENSADYGGGMWNSSRSNPTLTNCTFSGNTATTNGGGMHNHGGLNDPPNIPALTNCVFSGNTATTYGGGMYNGWRYYPALTNCTFSQNTADSYGAGIYNRDGGPMLTNCILWGNTPLSSQQIYDESSSYRTTNAAYSCVQGGWSGVTNIDNNPLFVDPKGPDNVVGTLDDNLRLQGASPCIDAGFSIAIPDDRDGNQRIVDDPARPDAGLGFPDMIDMGAYEYGSGPTLAADLDGDGDVDLDDFALFQQQFTSVP